MIYETKKITVKNNKEVIFRAPKVEDAEVTIAFLKKACGETEYLANYPEEWDGKEEGEKAYLEAQRKSPNNLMIVCEVDGVFAGNCQIMFLTSKKTCHRAEVAIAILKDFWGMGIGSAMFSEMENAAKDRGISVLTLDMIEGNERAFGLYTKMGYKTVAEIPDGFRFKDGSSHKLIYMMKKLK